MVNVLENSRHVLESFFNAANFYSPDVLFISPYFGNCLVLEKLHLHNLGAKILYVPILPTISPPFEVVPPKHDAYSPWETQA
jgi:hypothetical protein